PMTAQNLWRAVALLLLLPAALPAQVVRDEVPLKSWQAPLYWQPAQAENDATSIPSPLVFVGITPCRIVDTRAGHGFTGEFGPPSLAGSPSRPFPIQASTTCTIPPIAQAYSLNITMVRRGPL